MPCKGPRYFPCASKSSASLACLYAKSSVYVITASRTGLYLFNLLRNISVSSRDVICFVLISSPSSITDINAISSSLVGRCTEDARGYSKLLVSLVILPLLHDDLKSKTEGLCNPPFSVATNFRFSLNAGTLNSFAPSSISRSFESLKNSASKYFMESFKAITSLIGSFFRASFAEINGFVSWRQRQS
uniref:Uncharacterized protein n=1 Tax=Zea mays TaxID=4577 RepID=C4J2M6_MAIZE|nr:unknown [Zea mays]